MDIRFYNPDKFAPPGGPGKQEFHLPVVPVLILLLICGLLSFWLKFPSFLYPNVVRGEFMDLSLNPDGTLWILTDGSFKYIQTVSRPGYFSTGVQGMFCKTYLYLYDPINKKVIRKITARYKQLPNKCHLVREDGHLWQISWLFREPWIIYMYDVKTGEQLLDTDKFVSNHPELKPGIAQLSYHSDPDRISIKSKAGLDFEFLIEDDLLLPAENETQKKAIIGNYERTGLLSLFVFAGENSFSDSRQLLYRIDGATADLVSKLIWPFNGIYNRYDLQSFSGFSFTDKLRATPMTPGKVYLEPIMVYQDKELAVILSQDQIGEEARRMLTCVDSSGAEKWTVPPVQLFPEIMIRKGDSFASTFFVKDKIKGERQGNLFALKVQDLGAIGFNLETGKKLWQIKL